MMKEDILQTIIAYKKQEIRQQEEAVPVDRLIELFDESAPIISMKQALTDSPHGIIAEFKRRSPSKDWIKREADAAVIPQNYETAGAAALSILTDEKFFGGTLKDIRIARSSVTLPILRKDFIISPYQLYQAKAVKADAVLLIAAALTPEECYSLAQLAHELALEVLLEIHSEEELDHINGFIDMVGVNNRHLGTFRTDVANSFRLAEKLPKDKLLISESGISQAETVIRLRKAGFRGFLIGETWMKTLSPGETLHRFISSLNRQEL